MASRRLSELPVLSIERHGGEVPARAPVRLAYEPDVRLGPLTVAPARRFVGHDDGRNVTVEPRAMKVLVALLRTPGRVLTRDDLFDLCWEGRAVSDDAIDRAVGRLRRAAQPLAEAVFTVETVMKVGHRIVLAPDAAPGHPVGAGNGASGAGVSPVDKDPAAARAPAGAAARSRRRLAAGLFLLLLLAASFAIGFWQQRASPPPPVAIAVLPFRSLSVGDDAYFAEGVGEEIMAQLARQPGLRVAGRMSSRQFLGHSADFDEVARRLDISHVLEGSVRSAGGRVRVTVALTEASDGMQLWAETFDGTLDDIFTIQQRIGGRVSAALGQRLAAAEPAVRSATSGAVYSLYLSARGRIRERNPIAMAEAKAKLVRALRLDPGFAPAWASLAQVTRFEFNRPGPDGRRGREEAVRQARRALALAPDLAEGHGVLGMILGFEHPDGQRHVHRAAALDPQSAEFQFWLGHVLGNQRDYPGALRAYRAAFEADPLWDYAQHYLVETAWSLGRREEALAYARRVARDGSRQQAHFVRATLAGAAGDFSRQTAELASAAGATGDPGKRAQAQYRRAFVLFALGLHDEARDEWSRIWESAGRAGFARVTEYEPYFTMRRGLLPGRAELDARSASDFHKDQSYAALGAKRLINAGRARDVVALYDRRGGFLGHARARPQHRAAEDLSIPPIVAAALRAVGRGAEADAILLRADRSIAGALARSRGEVPSYFLAQAAGVWAMRGRHDAALSALEQARRRGWAYVLPDESDTSLPDIGDEPAFRSLRGHPRFKRLRIELRAHFARERRQILQGRPRA